MLMDNSVSKIKSANEIFIFEEIFNCDLSLAQQISPIANTRATHSSFKFCVSKLAKPN